MASVLMRNSLGKSGLKVSKVILGAMSYGSSKWQPWVLDEAESLPLLEHAYKCGINTWDTVCCSLDDFLHIIAMIAHT